MRGRLLEEGDELALPWDDLADGRAWPLVRGRDFFLNPKEVEEAAQNAATRIGKAVQTIRSLRASVLSVWVQFADYRLEPGMPCPCGSYDLRRINDEWAICASCESTLLVDTRPKGSDTESLVVETARDADDSNGASRLRIFVPESGSIGTERKRLAALRGAGGNGEKLRPASERKEARVGEREEKREAQAREREEKKATIRQTRDDKRREQQEARNRQREQQRQRREAEREVRTGGPKPRPGRDATPPPRLSQSAGPTLDRFTNVRLWSSETRRPGRYWGYGYDPKGRFVLLEVTLQLGPDGAPVEDPGKPGRALHAVNAVRSAPFSAAVDADALVARTDGMSPDDVLGLASR